MNDRREALLVLAGVAVGLIVAGVVVGLNPWLLWDLLR